MSLQMWLIPTISFLGVFLVVMLAMGMLVKDPEARLRTRLQGIKVDGAIADANALRRDAFLRRLSPLERSFEELPGMAQLVHLGEQAGYRIPGYRLALIGLALIIGAFVATLSLWHSLALAALAALGAGVIAFLLLASRRTQRMRLFEEQLPDVLDTMARALRAGNSLMETFKFVSDEMDEPVSGELNIAWSNLNYGISLKSTLEDLLTRMPSTSLQSLVAAILIQRETGGNLSEILDKLADVLRAKFRFERRVRTLSAEGRMSAWVLILMPIVLAVGLSVTTPTYLPKLYNDPLGRQMIVGAVVLMAIGIVWIRRIINIRF